MKDGPARSSRQLAGDAGEDAALAHLLGQGLALVDRNFRCRGGELDLVMRDGATLVFVEVRKRASRWPRKPISSATACRQPAASMSLPSTAPRCRG